VKPPFGVVVVHGSGVLRLSVPRWAAYGALGLGAAAMAATLGVAGENALLRRSAGDIDALRRRDEAQSSVIASFESRTAAIRREIGAWQMLHAKMWETFGGSPSATAGRSATGTMLAALAADAAGETPRLRDLEQMMRRTRRLLDGLPLRWPVDGPVRSGYGRRRSPWTGAPEMHEGIDIGSPPGTAVTAPATGAVVSASSWGDYGKHVVVDHGNGVRSL